MSLIELKDHCEKQRTNSKAAIIATDELHAAPTDDGGLAIVQAMALAKAGHAVNGKAVSIPFFAAHKLANVTVEDDDVYARALKTLELAHADYGRIIEREFAKLAKFGTIED